VTIRKIATLEYPPPSFNPEQEFVGMDVPPHIPAHREFREKYFQGFRKAGQ
jgi:tRNA (guanine10-N2)-methyltransferase